MGYPQRHLLIKFLRFAGFFLPGNCLKTWFYLNLVAAPRKAIWKCLTSFYRMDHIYDVFREFSRSYQGKFSVLEFGTSDGYAFTKMLYATRYLKLTDRVTVHGFDSFEGLPASADKKDQDLIANDSWMKGQFKGNYESLLEYCKRHYTNFRLHKGYFDETLTDDFLQSLRDELPVLVWIDCDYYSSAKTVFDRLLPLLPSGCVVYFDDYALNFGSRFTGEARLVHEVNCGLFGGGIELIVDPSLSLTSRHVYRFINMNAVVSYQRKKKVHSAEQVRRRTNDSPLP